MAAGIFAVDFTTEIQKTYAPTIYEKFSTFAPVYAPQLGYQLDYTYAPMMAIESPGARGAVVTTKKEASQTQDVTGATTEQSPTVSPSQVGPTSDPMSMILILGLVAVGGYVAVSLLKKKKKIKR
ncbi:hypothetical protein ES702_07146 [subsurface metagenome]